MPGKKYLAGLAGAFPASSPASSFPYGVGPLGCDSLAVTPAIRAGKNPKPLGLGVRQTTQAAAKGNLVMKTLETIPTL